MALDSVGNPRVDFAWGNFPMQPDDQRGLPLGGSYQVVGLDSYGPAGTSNIKLRSENAHGVVVGMTVTLKGLGQSVDSYNNPIDLRPLNRSYTVRSVNFVSAAQSYSGGPEVNVGITESLDQIAEVNTYIQPNWGSSVIPTALIPARLVVGGAEVTGGGAGDYGWSHTTPVNSAITDANNNPFENMMSGWNGYPGYLAGDFDDVPGHVHVPDVRGLSGTSVEQAILNAGFVPGVYSNNKSGLVSTTNFGSRYFGIWQEGTKARFQLMPADNLTIPYTLSLGANITLNYTEGNMGSYSGWLTSYPELFDLINNSDWVFIDGDAITGNWMYLETVEDVTVPTNRPSTWTDNYQNGMNLGIGSFSTTNNIGTVKYTVPNGGKTALPGQAIDVVFYGDVASGQVANLEISTDASTVGKLILKPSVSSYLPIIGEGSQIEISGFKRAYINWYNDTIAVPKWQNIYIDLAQLNKVHTVDHIDVNGRIYLTTDIAEFAQMAIGAQFSLQSDTGKTTLWELK